MLRTKIYNSKHEIAAVLDIVRHLTYHHFKNDFEANDTIYNISNVALYEKKDDAFVEVIYDNNKARHQFKNEANDLQKCELELIELVRSIDISVYVNSFTNADENFCNTDYEKMYDEDTTEVYFKAFIIAVAQYFQEKLKIGRAHV